METTVNANLNNADCIKSVQNIGHTLYENICNGNVSRVDWGSMDYILLGFVLLILVGAGALVLFVIHIARD